MTTVADKLAVAQLFKLGAISPRTVARVFGMPTSFEDVMSSIRGRSVAELKDIAAQQELVAIFPRKEEIFLDYDEPYASVVLKAQALVSQGPVLKNLAKSGIKIVSHLFTTSHSGNAHLYLSMNQEFNDYERVIIQAVLRSDPVRDIIYMQILRESRDNKPITLFETQAQAIEVKAWRLRTISTKMKKRIAASRYQVMEESYETWAVDENQSGI